MKKVTIRWSICIIISLWLGASLTLFAQERIIEPTEGFIDDIILADTANGAQAHNVYVFRRGETYYWDGTINNKGYALTLKAEDGKGALPLIVAYPSSSGELQRFLTAGNDVYLYNLFIDGMGPDLTTGEPDPYLAMSGQLLNAGAAGKELVVDGCILLSAAQTLIRSSSGARKLQFTNTIIANGGQLSSMGLGNGRVIDYRSGITDTTIFRNCTLINTYDRLFRHYGGAANATTTYLTYFELDHNTIIHNLGTFGFIFLGDIVGGVKITNNLFINPLALGADRNDSYRYTELNAIGEYNTGDSLAIMPLIINQPNSNYSPTYTISNNVVSYDNTVDNYMTKYGIEKATFLEPRIASLVSNANPFVEVDDITLNKIPNVMIEVMNWYQKCVDSLGTGYSLITTNEVDMDRRSRAFWADSVDCSYSTTDATFEGSDGLPVGSNAWDSKVVVGVEEETTLPTNFALANNYPNPFNPSTTISFTVPEKASVSMKVYNMIGQEVVSLTNQEYAAGTHTINFNAAGLSSGVYICRMNAVSASGKNFMASQKMTLLK